MVINKHNKKFGTQYANSKFIYLSRVILQDLPAVIGTIIWPLPQTNSLQLKTREPLFSEHKIVE